MKEIKIKNCCDCPYYPGAFGLNKEVEQPACEIKQQHIPDAKQIPEWCPLDDYKIAHSAQPEKYNFSCECGWLHLDVWLGFECKECGRVFNPENKKEK